MKLNESRRKEEKSEKWEESLKEKKKLGRKYNSVYGGREWEKNYEGCGNKRNNFIYQNRETSEETRRIVCEKQ